MAAQNVYVNDAYMEYLEADQYTQIFFGGSSSGKSFFLAQRTVMDNMNGYNYLICRNVSKTIKKSVFNEVWKAICNYQLAMFYSRNLTDLVITNRRNNKQILFSGLDDEEKLKSITPIDGVLERIWIEEATEIKRSAYMQLKKRLRGRTDKNKGIILSFNPILKSHWIYQEFFVGTWDESKRVYESDRLLILKTTYKDNLYLTPDDIYELEHETDEYYYNVYTLGNWGILGNVIFKNWETADLSGLAATFDAIDNGLDFGFTNPNALVRVHVSEKSKTIYVFDTLGKRGQTYDGLISDLRQKVGSQIVTCDNEDSRGIYMLQQGGIKAVPAKKGADSVINGITWLQGYKIVIDVKQQEFINEIQQYHWQEDKDGNVIEKPVKTKDHFMDALRYAVEWRIIQAVAQSTGRL
jgi:phage terminase large subunit